MTQVFKISEELPNELILGSIKMVEFRIFWIRTNAGELYPDHFM